MSLCCQSVRVPGMSMLRYRPCGCEAKVVRDNKPYCGRHDPVAKAARAAKLEPKKAATRRLHMIFYTAGLNARRRKRHAKSHS